MRISFELPTSREGGPGSPGCIDLAGQEVFLRDSQDAVAFKFADLPGFRIEEDNAPCALLSQSFFLKAIAIVAKPELAKELA